MTVQTYDYQFSAFLRYYLNDPQQFRPFVFLNTSLNARVYEQHAPIMFLNFENTNTVRAIFGVGADFFLHPNVAIEAGLGYKVLETGELNNFNPHWHDLAFDLGIQTFLSQKRPENFDLKEFYLKEGNYVLSGTGHLRTNFDSLKTTNIFFQPQLSRFITDRFALGGGINFSYNKNELHRSAGIGFDGTSRFYLPLNEKEHLSITYH